jgi:hypothetical protein
MWNEYSILDSVKVTYVRHAGGKRKRNKRGVLVSGINEDGKVCVGWSLCKGDHDDGWEDVIEGDWFDKYRGFEIAEARAIANDRLEKYITFADHTPAFDLIDDIIPQSIHGDLRKFMDRTKLYYKDAEFTEAAEYIYDQV